jgi:hypothetical protein
VQGVVVLRLALGGAGPPGFDFLFFDHLALVHKASNLLFEQRLRLRREVTRANERRILRIETIVQRLIVVAGGNCVFLSVGSSLGIWVWARLLKLCFLFPLALRVLRL